MRIRRAAALPAAATRPRRACPAAAARRGQAQQADLDRALTMQHAAGRRTLGLPGARGARVQANRRRLRGGYLPELHEDQRAVGAGRPVCRAWRIAQVPARGVVAAVVREGARQHQDLLAAGMCMGRKDRARRVAHQAGGMRLFGAEAVEHHPLDAGLRRGHPALRLGRHDGRAGEVGVHAHGGAWTGRAEQSPRATRRGCSVEWQSISAFSTSCPSGIARSPHSQSGQWSRFG